MFFYNQELRSHIRTEHEDPNDYLERFPGFETKVVYLKCEICKEDMKRSYSGIKQHLEQNHPALDPLAYQTKFKLFNYRLVKPDNEEGEDSLIDFKDFADFASGTCQYKCSICRHATFNQGVLK